MANHIRLPTNRYCYCYFSNLSQPQANVFRQLNHVRSVTHCSYPSIQFICKQNPDAVATSSPIG